MLQRLSQEQFGLNRSDKSSYGTLCTLYCHFKTVSMLKHLADVFTMGLGSGALELCVHYERSALLPCSKSLSSESESLSNSSSSVYSRSEIYPCYPQL